MENENKDLRIIQLERDNALLKKDNELLKKEVVQLKELLARAQEQKNHSDDRIGQAKDVAKKGLDMSKDFFSVTKNVFGKAKETFKEEWEKQKFNERQHTQDSMFANRDASQFANDLLKETLSKEEIAELSSKLEQSQPKNEQVEVERKVATTDSNENTLLSSLLNEDDIVVAVTIKQASSDFSNQIFDALPMERKSNITAILAELEEVNEEVKAKAKKYLENDSKE